MYLYSGFGETNLEGDFFPHENIGVARFAEKRLEHVQLRSGKGGPLSPLLPRIAYGGGTERKRCR
jgi:hypothetical protein